MFQVVISTNRCSGLVSACWNGEAVRLAFIIDAFDRRASGGLWPTRENPAPMSAAVEKRFDAPQLDSARAAARCFAPARQEQSVVGKRQRCVTQGPQVSDEVRSLLFVVQARESHICSRQRECRVCDKKVEFLKGPIATSAL